MAIDFILSHRATSILRYYLDLVVVVVIDQDDATATEESSVESRGSSGSESESEQKGFLPQVIRKAQKSKHNSRHRSSRHRGKTTTTRPPFNPCPPGSVRIPLAPHNQNEMARPKRKTKNTEAEAKNTEAEAKKRAAVEARKKRQAEQEAERKQKKKKKQQDEEEEAYSDLDDDRSEITLSPSEIRARDQVSRTKRTGKPKGEVPDTVEASKDDVASLLKQLEDMKKVNERLKNRNKAPSGKGKGKKPGTSNAMNSEVEAVAKTDLWQKCKQIRNQKYLVKATKCVMHKLDLKEFQGLEGEDLELARKDWVEDNKETVRKSINEKRNYCLGEVRDFMVPEIAAGRADQVPNQDEIVKLAFRQFDEEDEEDDGDAEASDEDREAKKKEKEAARARLMNLFLQYWDVLLSKICGSDYWSPTKRHYGCISSMLQPATKDNPDPDPYVDPSAEAMLVWGFLNAYDRWELQAEYLNKNKQAKLTSKDPGYMDPLARHKSGPNKGEFKEERANTTWTTSTSGQAKWGGITPEGRNKITELTNQIAQNRKENADYIREVEEEALALLRKKHGRDQIDERRKARGKKRPNWAEEEEEEDEEDEEDPDFHKW